ncbi:MAG TPA: peptidoglycan DD-metalloendopeptidase family protein [Anaerolineaceae bacterium]|nr:peptidoglycan DD-metalloendopeptidase family protein [Anaerolineaceae bacterium]
MKFRFLTWLILLALATGAASLTGCAASKPLVQAPSSANPTLTVSPIPATATATLPAPSATPLPPTSTPEPQLELCSPIEHIPLERIGEIVQGPMQTPHPGQDDGHHGVDFAFYRFDDLNGIEGLDINSVFAGKVVASIVDRKPYGNFVIIETPLDQLPPAWLDHLAMPTPSPAMPLDPRMAACPAVLPSAPNGPGRSLYLLYGHFQEASPLQIGDQVTCGQTLGQAGNTGMSGNPHLHLEARVGPSGATFPAMNFYDTAATNEELGNYCLWRVSQVFQLIDPLNVLGIQ